MEFNLTFYQIRYTFNYLNNYEGSISGTSGRSTQTSKYGINTRFWSPFQFLAYLFTTLKGTLKESYYQQTWLNENSSILCFAYAKSVMLRCAN